MHAHTVHLALGALLMLVWHRWERIQRGVRDGTISWSKVYFPFWFHAHTAHLAPYAPPP